VSEKYAFIDAEYATVPQQDKAPTVTQMCEWLGVAKSGYYDWRGRPESETEKRRKILKLKIRAIFDYNNEEYGYRRVHAALVRGGESVDDETVRKLMRELGLEPNGIALGDLPGVEQVELDSAGDAGDGGLARFPGREVAGLLGFPRAGPVRAVAGEEAGREDFQQERGQGEVGLFRGKKPPRCRSRRPGRAGS
jgi:hypothetical protein